MTLTGWIRSSLPHALVIAGLCALGAPAVAQDGEETARTGEVTIRATPGSELVRLELRLSDGEEISLTTDLVEIAAGGSEAITGTLRVDGSGEVQLCPPEAEKPRVMIGVTTEPLTEALGAQLRLGLSDAVVVADVSEGMPAQEAGVCRFDIITAVDGATPVTQDSLRARVEQCSPGDKILLSLLRAGTPIHCEVVARPYVAAVVEGVALDTERLQSLAWSTALDRTIAFRDGDEIGNLVVEPRVRYHDFVNLTPLLEIQPYVTYDPSVAAPDQDAQSPEARLRAEIDQLKEKIAAIESILNEIESGER